MNISYAFGGNPLDRVQALRRDLAWLDGQRVHPRARYLPLRALNAAVHAGDPSRLAWLNGAALEPWLADAETVLLGLLDDVPHFAMAADHLTDDAVPEGIEFVEPRALAASLAVHEAGMLAQARSVIDWHATHQFCSKCGAPTESIEGGARRACTACGTRHYPVVSPSMIVLVTSGDRCLLARRPRGIPTRFSCLAGYLEPAESIEESVAREVAEECGVQVGSVQYHSSQPWPFPATLMIGCYAEATSEEITVDGVEIAEARWFSRDEVRAAVAGEPSAPLSIPDSVSISHHLIANWANQ
jgi:NAD+ diphosphatase